MINIRHIQHVALAKRPILGSNGERLILGAGYRAGGIGDLFAGKPCPSLKGFMRDICGHERPCALSISMLHALKHALSHAHRRAEVPHLIPATDLPMTDLEDATRVFDFMDHPHLMSALSCYVRINEGEEGIDRLVAAIRATQGRDPFDILVPYRDTFLRYLRNPIPVDWEG